jgi:hypothetical protein
LEKYSAVSSRITYGESEQNFSDLAIMPPSRRPISSHFAMSAAFLLRLYNHNPWRVEPMLCFILFAVSIG